MDRPVLVPREQTPIQREPEPRDVQEASSAQAVPEGQQSGFCRDGTIGERGEKDADFDEDGTRIMPLLRAIHKFGHLVPRAKVAEYSNVGLEDLDAGNQSFFNPPITQRKTESDVGTQTAGGGSGAPGDIPIGGEDEKEDRPVPTKISKLAFKLQGKITFQGLPIAIENKAGSVRKGVDPDGTPWRTKMKLDYGYIKGTEGADGEGVDCYVGPDEDADSAFVVHQKNPKTGKYDEDKVMLGFSSKAEAKDAFGQHYDDPSRFLGPIDEVSMRRLNKLVAAKGKLVKISAVTVQGFLQEVQKVAFDQVLGMGPESRGPFMGAPAPWQPYQPSGPTEQVSMPSPFGAAAQDLRSARKTVNLARKLWAARSSIPVIF